MGGFVHHHQGLRAVGSLQRGHQPTAHRQLIDPSLGNRLAASGSHDGCIGRALGKTQHTIAKKQMNVGQAQGAQVFARLVMQAAQPLDAVDLGSQVAGDRCLVAAYDSGMTPLLILTKADLGEPHELLAQYEPLGIRWFVTDVGASGAPDATLIEALTGHNTVLVGHSGVGKSNLINALIPSADRAIGNVTAKHMMNRAMELADQHGIGLVALRNANHWMRGGGYGYQAAEKGYVGICWSNSIAVMPPWGAKECRICQ